MPDEFDLASEREDIARRAALEAARRGSGPQATGACLYCGERLPKPMRWCGANCRNEWQQTNPDK